MTVKSGGFILVCHQPKPMQILAFITAFLGGGLIFLAIKQSVFRLVAGIGSLVLAILIYSIANSLVFINSFGVMGLILWLALNVVVLMAFIYELKVKTLLHRLISVICLGSVSFLNLIFALLFVRAAGLGVV